MKSILTSLLGICLAATLNGQAPGAGYALDFNGSGDDVSVKDHASLNPTKAITVEAWIKADSYGSNIYDNSIVCKHHWPSGRSLGYVLRCGNGGRLSFNVGSGSNGWKECQSAALMSTGRWYHVAGVFDGDTVRAFLNGVQVAAQAYSGSIGPATGYILKIGELAGGTGRNFDGSIDNVRIWDTCITTASMRDYMCKKLDSKHPFSSHLAAEWNMDSGKGKTIADVSKNSNTGSLGSPSWVRSGAAIGDASVHDYTGSKVSLTASSGDILTADKFSLSLNSVHMYYVGDTTDVGPSKGVVADFDSSHYFGVYADGTGSTFNLHYDYDKYSKIASGNECNLEMFTKSSHAATSWNDFSAKLDASANTVTRSAAKPGEFIIGFYGTNKTIVTSTGDSTLCQGDTMTLGAPGNSTFKYVWYRNGVKLKDTVGSIRVGAAGKYKADVIRDANCQFTTNEKTIAVNTLPTVNLPSVKSVCESVDSLWITGATPKGGTFVGKGLVKDSLFGPSAIGKGNYEVSYEVVDQNGCKGSDTINVEVFGLPNVTIGLAQGICNNIDSVVLNQGKPVGGTYTGGGVTRNQFFPANVSQSTGIFPIRYSYTDTNGCVNSAKGNVKLLGANAITFPPSDTVCVNGDIIRMKAQPFGGTYSGKGIANRDFDPAIAGVGSHYVLYEFSNADNCKSQDSHLVVVNNKPSASFINSDSICINGGIVTLNLATPTGGVYMGTGVTGGNSFVATQGSLGDNPLTYVYFDANGCADTATSGNMKVLDTTALSIGTISGICENASPATLSVVSPMGGTYSGLGVSSGAFDPSLTGAGNHAVGYSYQNASGCISGVSFSQEVFKPGKASIQLASDVCENADSFMVGNVKPAGGMLTGNGINGQYFVPSKANAGNNKITYTAADSNGCEVMDTASILVNEKPVVGLSFDNSRCDDETNFTIDGGTPAGGKYFVGALETDQFNPKARRVGTFDIHYEFTDANGCTNRASVDLYVNETPDKPTISSTDTELTSSADNGNQWFDDNGAINGATDKTFSPTAKGDYYVVVTSDSGCVATSDKVFFENISAKRPTAFEVSAYPNPNNGQLNISVHEKLEDAQIIIMSQNGELMHQQAFNGQSQISTQDWATGFYHIQIISAKGTASLKVLRN